MDIAADLVVVPARLLEQGTAIASAIRCGAGFRAPRSGAASLPANLQLSPLRAAPAGPVSRAAAATLTAIRPAPRRRENIDAAIREDRESSFKAFEKLARAPRQPFVLRLDLFPRGLVSPIGSFGEGAGGADVRRVRQVASEDGQPLEQWQVAVLEAASEMKGVRLRSLSAFRGDPRSTETQPGLHASALRPPFSPPPSEAAACPRAPPQPAARRRSSGSTTPCRATCTRSSWTLSSSAGCGPLAPPPPRRSRLWLAPPLRPRGAAKPSRCWAARQCPKTPCRSSKRRSWGRGAWGSRRRSSGSSPTPSATRRR